MIRVCACGGELKPPPSPHTYHQLTNPSPPPTHPHTPTHQHNSRFARALRLRLWAEHLGLLDDKVRASVLARLAREGRGPGMMGAEEDGSWGLEGLVDGGVTPEEVAFAPILDPVAPEVSGWEDGVMRCVRG